MAKLTRDDVRMELRGYIRPADPLWSQCMDLPPRKALTMVLTLAKEALDMREHVKHFTDVDHPFGQRLNDMTPPVALLYLIHRTRYYDSSENITPGHQNSVAKSPVATQLGDKSERLASVIFDSDELFSMSMLPDQPS